VSAPYRVRLSPAQVSALECRGVDGLDSTTLAAWNVGAGTLTFGIEDVDALLDELTDASNAEDAFAEAYKCPYARRAAMSLSVIGSKVIREVQP